MPTLAGNKHISIHILSQRLRLFHLSKEKVRVQYVRNGHQSDYSRADTIVYIIKKRSNTFPILENININNKNNNNKSSDYIKYYKTHVSCT